MPGLSPGATTPPSLGPTGKDAWALPLLPLTFDWQDHDIRMTRFMAEKMRGIALAMDPEAQRVDLKSPGEHSTRRAVGPRERCLGQPGALA